MWKCHTAFFLCILLLMQPRFYTDWMSSPKWWEWFPQKGEKKKFLYTFTISGIICIFYYRCKFRLQPPLRIRNSVLCLPQMSLYYINVTHHRTTPSYDVSVCAQVTLTGYFIWQTWLQSTHQEKKACNTADCVPSTKMMSKEYFPFYSKVFKWWKMWIHPANEMAKFSIELNTEKNL